ncbi:MAG: hypothetical protein IJ348_03115 [Alistipes sp.]|nr:hypothetical protein [Alistipes sp.]
MIRAIFYKEWIKIRWYWLLALVASIGFSGFAMLRLARAVSLKGADHIWQVMIDRDAIFIDLLQYLPLFLGLGLAVVQFVPEMQRKSFKLTLHLPIKATTAVSVMLAYGAVMLLTTFIPAILIKFCYLQSVLAPELWQHILYTAAPWYMAGLAAYFFTAWVALEPTWGRRVLDGVIALLFIRIYFQPAKPEAYNDFMPLLTVVTLMLPLLSMLSLTRFRDGRQD